jgi:hypothetical protein
MERNFRKLIQNAPTSTLRSRAMLVPLAVTLLFISATSPRFAHGAELTATQQAYLKKLDQPVVLRGDYFKAITVAYKDFSNRLAADGARSTIEDGQRATTLQWLSHIENYDIDVEQTDAAFVVYFSSTVRGDAPIILGGTVKYEIDRKTFKITTKFTEK